MRAVLTEGSIPERQALLRQFMRRVVRRVVLHLDRVTIEYRFRPELDPTPSSTPPT
jgi:hypothetical protein